MKYRRVFRYSLSIFLLWFFVTTAWAQETKPIINASLVGTVIDAVTKEPIAGATVQLEAVTHSVKTDRKGKFQFVTGQKLPFTVIVSYVGYANRTVVVSASPAVIELSSSTENLDEVVVTGVAQASNRKSLSFALTKISDELINTVPGTDASQTLRGKVAGIQINQSAGNSEPTIYLRGAKSISGDTPPLLVVDGFVTTLSLGDLNPQDIASIEIVKGAAASALYGTRGEGGVIQVLTKKGSGDGKVDIVVDNEYGVNSVQNMPKTTNYHPYKVNPDGSFVLEGNARVVDYQENGFSVNLHPYQYNYDNVSNLLGSSSYYSNFISVSNRSDRYSLYTSFLNQHKGGVIEPIAGDKRRSATLNLGYKASDKISTELTVQYFNNDRPSLGVAENTFYAALMYEPFINLKETDAEGNYLARPYGFDIQSNNDTSNPFYVYTNRDYSNISNNILLGGKINYRISEEFNAEVFGSIQRENVDIETYYPPGFETPIATVTLNNGNYSKQSQEISSRNFQALLAYNKTLGDWRVGAALKSVYEESKLTGFSASGHTLSAAVKDLSVTQPDTREVSSEWEQTVNYGYFLNLKGAWKDKLFIDALGRIDQSSRFGADVASAFFPRISAAYRLTEDVPLRGISELKFRAAYGQAGSLPPFGAKDSEVTISSTGGVSFAQLENTSLKRAITTEYEIGIDAVLLNRISINATYANAKSENDFILVPAFLPTSGSADIYSNLGVVNSNSLELEINGNVLKKGTFSWDAGVVWSRVRGRIQSLGDAPEFTENNFRKAVGHSPYAYYGRKIFTNLSQLLTNESGYVTNAFNGAYQLDDFTVNQLGFVVLKDQLGTADESPVYYSNEATGDNDFIGDAQPDFTLGFTSTFRFGRLSIYGVVDWSYGGVKYNYTQQRLIWQKRDLLTEEVARAGLPLSFADNVYNSLNMSDYWLEDRSYVSLRELSVNYQIPFPERWLGNTLRQINIGVTGRNLFLFTDFQGITPEGIYDNYNYPNYRIISGKLTLTF